MEVHLEVPLPDHTGRTEIFGIHTNAMRRSGRIGNDVDLMTLSDYTEGFSGAEIAGACRSAVSFALDDNDDEDEVRVSSNNFENALNEIKLTKENLNEEIEDASINYDGLLQS